MFLFYWNKIQTKETLEIFPTFDWVKDSEYENEILLNTDPGKTKNFQIQVCRFCIAKKMLGPRPHN